MDYSNQPYDLKNAKYAGFPMKWYKFTIYFLLWADAVLYFLAGATTLGGFIAVKLGFFHSDLSPLNYRLIDVLFGIFCIFFAVYAIYVRYRLAGLRRNGPLHFLICVFLRFSVATLFNFLSLSTFREFLTASSIIGFLISGVFVFVFLFLNYRYYNRRMGIFVN